MSILPINDKCLIFHRLSVAFMSSILELFFLTRESLSPCTLNQIPGVWKKSFDHLMVNCLRGNSYDFQSIWLLFEAASVNLLITQLVISAYMTWTYCRNLISNPYVSYILSKYIFSTVSKDFSKSTSRMNNFTFLYIQ